MIQSASEQARRILRRVILWRHIAPVGLLTLAALVTFRQYFYVGGYPAGWDIFSIILPVEFFSTEGRAFRFYEDTSLGQTVPLTLGHLLAWINSFLRAGPLVIKAAMAFNIWLLPMGMYFLAHHWSRSRVVAFLAGLIYLLSPQAMSKVADGQFFLAMALAVFPLLLLLLDSALAKPTRGKAAGLGLMGAFLLLLRGDPLLYGGLLVASYTVFTLIVPLAEKSRRRQAQDAIYLAAVGLPVLLLVSSFFWLPLLTAGSPLAGQTFSLETLQTTTLGPLHTFLGHSLIYSYFFWDGLFGWNMHAFLPKNVFLVFLAVIPVLSLGAFAAAYAGLVKNRHLQYLGILVLLTLPLALGPRWPMTDVYPFLLSNFEPLQSVHEPNRFLMLTWIAYAYGSAWVLVRLVGNADIKDAIERRLGPRFGLIVRATPLVLLTGWLLAVSPSLTHGFRVWQPDDSGQKINAWLEANADPTARVLYVPFGYSRQFVSDGWLQHDTGQMGSALANRRVLRIVGQATPEGAMSRSLANMLGTERTDQFASLAGALGARYIVSQAYPITQPAASTSAAQALPPKHRWTYLQQDQLQNMEGLIPVWVGPKPDARIKAGASWEGGKFARQSVLPPRQEIAVNRAPQIFENSLWQPQVSIVPRAFLVAGDLSALTVLAKQPDFSFGNSVVVSVEDILREGGITALERWAEAADRLLLVNTDLTGIAVELSEGIEPSRPALIETTGWQKAKVNTYHNWSTWHQNSLVAEQPSDLLLEFAAPDGSAGKWEVWVEALYASNTGSLSVLHEGNVVGTITPWTSGAPGYEWAKVGELSLGDRSGQVPILLRSFTRPRGATVVVRRVKLVASGAVEESVATLNQIVTAAGLPTAMHMDSGTIERYRTRLTNLQQFQASREVFGHNEMNLWDTPTPGVILAKPPENPNSRAPLSFQVDSVPRENAVIGSVEFPTAQDWSQADFISFWFKGSGRGQAYNIYVYFSGPGINRVAMTWRDTSDQWRQILMPLGAPNLSEGEISWDRVKRMILDNPSRSAQGTLQLKDFRLFQAHEGTIGVRAIDGEYSVRVKARGQVGGGTFQIRSANSPEFNTNLLDSVASLNLTAGGPVEWSNPLPDALTLTNGMGNVGGKNADVLKVTRSAPAPAAAILRARFTNLQDWSQAKYLSFWMKGTGSTTAMTAYLYLDPLYENRSTYSFADSVSGWQRVVIPLDRPNQTEGTPDLSRVDQFVLDIPDRRVTGSFEFARFSLIFDDLAPEEVSFTSDFLLTDEFKIVAAGSPNVELLQLLPPGASGLIEPYLAGDSPRELVFSRQSPTEYWASIRASETSFVVFQDAFSKQWELDTGLTKIEPMPGNFATNVFLLEGPFEGTVNITFRGERIQSWALRLSLIGLILTAVLILWNEKWRTRTWEIRRWVVNRIMPVFRTGS